MIFKFIRSQLFWALVPPLISMEPEVTNCPDRMPFGVPDTQGHIYKDPGEGLEGKKVRACTCGLWGVGRVACEWCLTYLGQSYVFTKQTQKSLG